jgi:uncharacterized protein YecE (DUF72 family)
MTEQRGRAFVGTSGWNKKQWRPGFYPAGLPQRDELGFASARLTSIEINSTFYALPKPATFEAWRDTTPQGFVFAVKGWRVVSRTAFFPTAQAHVAEFFASGVLGLGEKLGPILWQLPDNSKFDATKVERFLALLPHSTAGAAHLAAQSETSDGDYGELPDLPLRHAIEVRDPSYLDTVFIELLRAHNVAVVFTNSPDAPEFREPTADFVYLRLSSGDDHFADGYDAHQLDAWAAQIAAWVAGPPARDVFAYFKNPAGVLPHTPHNATGLIARL